MRSWAKVIVVLVFVGLSACNPRVGSRSEIVQHPPDVRWKTHRHGDLAEAVCKRMCRPAAAGERLITCRVGHRGDARRIVCHYEPGG